MYGKWNNSKKVIDFYLKDKDDFLKMKNKIERFPKQPGKVAKDYREFMCETRYPYEEITSTADLRLTFKMSLYPFGEENFKLK